MGGGGGGGEVRSKSCALGHCSNQQSISNRIETRIDYLQRWLYCVCVCVWYYRLTSTINIVTSFLQLTSHV